MKRQAFQRGEIRDENDNIISEGAYGKKTAFANKTNDGILDYIINNFQALFDMISGAYVYVDTLPTNGDSDKLYVVNSTGKTYRWDGKQFVFVSESVDGLSAYEIAKQNGFEGTEQEWIKSIVSDTIESAETDASGNLIFTMKSGGKIKTTLQPIVECINYMNLSKKWAVASESPDNESDTESETGKTLSSKSWALASKTYASQAKKSETNAINSENNALQYKNAANDSKTAAATSASNASKSEVNAKASANAASTSASNAKLSETHASTSETNTKQALAEAQKIQKQIESDVATLTSAVKYKGSVNSFSDLPTKNAIGDMYNIKNAGGTDSNNTPIKAGDNVVWNGTGWDNQSGIVDLSDYVKSSEVYKTIIDTTCSDDTITFIHKDGTKSKATINNVLQATRANQDGDGNDISKTYYKKADASTAHQSLKTTLDGKINKSGDTMTGALNLANNTWNLAGDDAYFGDANKSGCLCIKGANNDTGLVLVNRNDAKNEDCAIIRYSGKNIVVNKSIDGNITGTAETANKLHSYANRPASANKQFGDGNMYYYLATSAMKEGKPPEDATIIHLSWDNQFGYDNQIAIGDTNNAYWRRQNSKKWGNWRTFLDSDNFNTYVPKLDGTGAAGNWNINAKTATAATKLETARKINGVAFDGTADISAPWSQNKAAQTIDLTASTYDQDTWYPVVISAANMCVLMEYICYTWLGNSGIPSWATHAVGFTTVVDVCVRNSRWGEYIFKSYIKHDTNSFCKNNVPPAIFIIDARYPNGAVWYLRGGGKYNLFTSDPVTWRVVTAQTTINGSGSNAQLVAPTTTPPVSNISNKLVTSDLLATVATSGSYVDLSNKPNIQTYVASSPCYYERIALPESNKTQITMAPTWVNIGNKGYVSLMYQTLDLANTASWSVTSGTNYTTGTSRKGKDFYIYAVPKDNSLSFTLSDNSTVPTGYTADNSRKIGGFHCECADIGTISGHPLSGYLAGDILPASIWDLQHRPISSPEGMVFDGKKWIDIYIGSWDGKNIVSKFGGVMADGESSKKFHGELFEEEYAKVGKSLLSRKDFMHCMKGIQEGVNVKGSADVNTTGGHVNTNGVRIVSNYGIEDCAGVIWQWGSDLVEGGAYGTTDSGDKSNGYNKWLNGYSWINDTDSSVYSKSIDGDSRYGSCYGFLRRLRFGGSWGVGSSCGSRSAYCDFFSADRYGRIAGRGCSEPLR